MTHGDPAPKRLATSSALGGILLALAFGAACWEGAASQLAGRILRSYQRESEAKPLPVSHVVYLRLFPLEGVKGPPGKTEIAWERGRYRESVSSAGLTTVRGIESGKAYYTDEDGVTRVASEPVLRELLTRSYFWRRAFLFRDREKARVALGPADDSSVSVRILPRGGNTLLLSFSRRDSRLLRVASPRFHLFFETPTLLRDNSNRKTPVRAEVAWVGLPTGKLPEPSVGGGRARFSAASAEVSFERCAGLIAFPADVSGIPARVGIDAAADGPTLLSPSFAGSTGLLFRRDIFGRSVAEGATLTIDKLAYPSLKVAVSEALPKGLDALLGGALFRETIVEYDPAAARVRFHDPEKWIAPEGFHRVVIDDDGNRPVAILKKGRSSLRLLAGSETGGALLELAPELAARVGTKAGDTRAAGLRWGWIELSELSLQLNPRDFDPDWGDDGKVGFGLLLKFHAFVDMPHRWVYLKPLDREASGVRQSPNCP